MAGNAVEYMTNRVNLNFTKDGTWQTVSLLGVVHADALIVILQFEVAAGGNAQTIACRYPLDTIIQNSYVWPTGSVYVATAVKNPLQRIHLKAADSTARVYVVAAFLAPAARPHAGLINKSPSAVSTWDAKTTFLEGSDDATDIEAVILVANNLPGNVGTWGARCYGSSSTVTFLGDVQHRNNWVPVQTFDADFPPPWGGLYEVYSTGKVDPFIVFVPFWEVGYILKGYGLKSVHTVAPENPAVSAGWTLHNMSGKLPGRDNEGGFMMMQARGAPHDHGIKYPTSTDPVIPRWGSAPHDGGCGRAEFWNAPGIVDKVWYQLNAAAVDLWLFAWNEKTDTLLPNDADLVLTASGEVERSLAPAQADLVLETAGQVDADLLPGQADLVLETAGQVDANLLPGPADLVLTASGEVERNLLPGPADLVLIASGEVERSLAPAQADLVLEMAGQVDANLLPGSADLVLEMAGQVDANLLPGQADLVLAVSGQPQPDVPVELSPSPASLVLTALGQVIGALVDACHWLYYGPERQWHVDEADQDLLLPAAGGWFDDEGAQEFASMAASGWRADEGAQEFASEVGGGWFDEEGAQDFTSPAGGGWSVDEEDQELTSGADGDWQTRKPCG